MTRRAALLASLALRASADFAHIVRDARGVFWFEQNGQRFTSRVVNHVNNGGPDDGVNGRESAVCRAATNNSLCGDSLNFGGALGYSPYWNVVQAKYNGSVAAWADAAISRLAALGFNGVSGWSAAAASDAAARRGGFASFQLLDAGVTWPDAWSKGLDNDVCAFNAQNAEPARCARNCDPNDPNTQPYARSTTLNQQGRPPLPRRSSKLSPQPCRRAPRTRASWPGRQITSAITCASVSSPT
jgi:hypothetical protein